MANERGSEESREQRWGRQTARSGSGSEEERTEAGRESRTDPAHHQKWSVFDLFVELVVFCISEVWPHLHHWIRIQ